MKPIALGLLLLTGCTASRGTERFVITGDAQTLKAAAIDASGKLGWTTVGGESGKFEIVAYPRQSRVSRAVLNVSAEDDVLVIEGERDSGLAFLPETSRILASVTAQSLGQQTGGAAVESRSKALTLGLDLLLPAAGAFYALRGDPYFDSGASVGMRGFWWEFWGRLGLDIAAQALLVELVLLRRLDGSQVLPAWALVAPIFLMVASRVNAMISDWIQLDYRNSYARSGFHAPQEP